MNAITTTEQTNIATANMVMNAATMESMMVANKVDSLRKEISKTRSDAEMKVRSLEDKVQKLLAITNEVKDEA